MSQNEEKPKLKTTVCQSTDAGLADKDIKIINITVSHVQQVETWIIHLTNL